MVPRWFLAVLAVVLSGAILAACGSGDGSGEPGGGVVLVATTTQVADLARAVAGDRAQVRQILQPNSDPHEYEPRPSDVRAVSGASVVVRSGGDVDTWLDGVLHNAGSTAKRLTLIDAMKVRHLDGDVDPHWWQNPRNAIIAAGEIRDALIRADPAGRARYTSNTTALIAKLQRLDHAIAGCMRAIPAARRKLVTDHDALGYYADRYGIDVIGRVIPALSTRAQASAGEVVRLVATIRAAGVKTIYSESSVNPKLTRAIARDAGATVGPALYADSLGPPGSPGATYIGSLRFNTMALASGFAGARTPCRV